MARKYAREQPGQRLATFAAKCESIPAADMVAI
jgi:hypothetical protein